jgi:hypothetical protein
VDAEFLSPQERAKLRPSIDVPALERLLARAPQESRSLILLACARDITDADLRAVGVDPAELHPATALPPELPRRGDPHRIAFIPVRSKDLILSFNDADLQRLWQDVERGRT